MARVWGPETNEYIEAGDNQYTQRPVTLSSPMADPAEQSRYNERLKGMSAPQSKAAEYSAPEKSTAPSSDNVGKTGASDKEVAVAKMAQDAASGGTLLDTAGSGSMMAGLAGVGLEKGATGMNPYLVGAGLGLTALSSVQKAKQQREQNRYEAEMQKYQARQNAIQNLAQIGQNLKA